MAFCGKCGSAVTDGVPFCPQCGAAVGASAVPAQAPVAITPAATSGLQENVAGLLCYLLGWLTGIIFLLIDKRPFVRFHAAQSIVVFGGLSVIQIVLRFGFIGSGLGGFWFWSMISLLVSLVTLIAWIILMVQAYQGKMFEVPIAAGIAKSIAGSTSV
ncbi:MAG TPA: zinc-ribbon domain-containing protein [Silvibacterium sp.]|nr:zinc-ribbon domain-containing protein [Silvibacterium sp.]